MEVFYKSQGVNSRYNSNILNNNLDKAYGFCYNAFMNERSRNHYSRGFETKEKMPLWQKTAGVIAVVGTIAFGAYAAKEALDPPDAYELSNGKTTEWVVHEGDTAWKIAKEISQQYKESTGKDLDVADIVEAIEAHNPDTGNISKIGLGDRFVIPDYSNPTDGATG